MESAFSILNQQAAGADVVRRNNTNQTWLLAEKIARILVKPNDDERAYVMALGTMTRRWLRKVQKNRWEIEHALIDLEEKQDIRNRAAYLQYRIKYYEELVKEEKNSASTS